MIRLTFALFLTLCTALPALAQERVFKWHNLDPMTTETLLNKLESTGFELQGMRPLTLIINSQACSAGCTVRNAGCACPKQGDACAEGTTPSPGGALCTGPLNGAAVMLEDGRISTPVDLP
ncbi:hypothetical protein J7443_08200 [Tropicibacter sp. R15_0]|uniref:hypothetical protein n=1 Tax=Tropicibacter sp. R15_0 TaxID=2821101 RepID=UPI001ADAF5DD|nr:hypothetical protein [Tropicibacter sp. R15_0]MBO9465205.1 hypothetical protein [Tropicibacter sp. R15_0]